MSMHIETSATQPTTKVAKTINRIDIVSRENQPEGVLNAMMAEKMSL